MLDLGTSFLASVARDPNACAIVDSDLRLTYAQWYRKISALVAGFDAMGLKPGDHLVTALQNRWEAATLHWACQFAGIVITPINWRAKADGSGIRTVEGLAPAPGRLSILQEAFRRHHALQCGFCTPGILMSLDDFLRHHPDVQEMELREFLSGHLCRCTGYVPIVAAALDAAKRLREPEPHA
jgi:hypothetical protein